MVAACWTDGNLNHAGASSSSTSSLSVPLPTGHQSGHLALIFACATHNTSHRDITTPAGWKLVANVTGGSAFPNQLVRIKVFGRVLDGTEAANVTLAVDPGEIAAASIWLDAKLNGDRHGGWLDDIGTAADTLTLPALTADRTDNIFLWFTTANDNSGLDEPSGFCTLELFGAGGGQQDVNLAVKRVSAAGSTGSTSAQAGSGDRAVVGMLVPMNLYPWPTPRPVVGYVGIGPLPQTGFVSNARITEDGYTRITEDGDTRIWE